MKLTILALTAFVVATAPLAWAQEEGETPAPMPETTAPEQSESPAADPSVSVTTEKSPPPAAEKSSSPAATKSSSPAAAKSSSPAGPTKASSPAKSSSPASTKPAATAAVMPTKKSTPEATLRDIENKWEASIALHDPSVAQAYLGNDYRGVSSKGKVMNNASLLAEIKKDTDTYTFAKNGNMDVRVYGGKFAVVMGTSTEVGKAKDGKAFKRSFRWTDAWVDRDGKWQCVASQAMLLSK
jgi:cytoskeletal protein RodZ